MKAVIQRVSEAKVSINGEKVGEIGAGMLILLGIADIDTDEDMAYLLRKIPSLRIFDDENGIMNKDIRAIEGDILLVSQFTLLAETKKGNRPSYIKAARPDKAQKIYDEMLKRLEQHLGKPIQKGKFGADMQVSLINDGPVTIIIDSHNK